MAVERHTRASNEIPVFGLYESASEQTKGLDRWCASMGTVTVLIVPISEVVGRPLHVSARCDDLRF